MFIVGGAGFLGKETAKLLKKYDYDVLIADLPINKYNCPAKIQFIPFDITNTYSISNFDFGKNDIIVNLASNQYHNKVSYFKRQKWFDKVNFHGATNLMKKAINSNGGGYIYFSSDMVYGIPKNIPVLENSELSPLAEYGFSKNKSEKVDGIKSNRYLDIQKAANFSSLSVSTLRRAVARGSLKCSRTLGKLLFRESDIERWLNG